MKDKFFTLETPSGNAICGSIGELTRAVAAAKRHSKTDGEVQVIERNDWVFVRLRGIAQNGEYTRVVK